MIAKTPSPPYYAVIFSSTRTEGDNGYSEMSEKMVELASRQDGFLGVESARDGLGITVSYWRDLESIKKWKANTEHTTARNKGRSDWYQTFKTRIAKVERDYGFEKDSKLNNDIRIAHITLLVDDYDKAIDFFTNKLNFILIEDTKLSDAKRWVVVKPRGSENCCLLLAKASNAEQKKSIGNQSGGRVFLFLQTDNFKRDYQNLIDKGIRIVREPKTEDYGTVVVFEDIYGNLWDLIEASKSPQTK